MHLDWTALGKVAVVSFGATVALVAVFALGVLGLSQVAAARERGAGAGVSLAQAGVCFVACAAVVVYGIYLIVPQFH
ncbi:hypothetical protein [Streptomyces sp. NPDC049813]|uniref:hypothetical protein n=1 Tax=Streptomyces sp. NPDC049813 TaxID=3365597 RepID=UPI003791C22A